MSRYFGNSIIYDERNDKLIIYDVRLYRFNTDHRNTYHKIHITDNMCKTEKNNFVHDRIDINSGCIQQGTGNIVLSSNNIISVYSNWTTDYKLLYDFQSSDHCDIISDNRGNFITNQRSSIIIFNEKGIKISKNYFGYTFGALISMCYSKLLGVVVFGSDDKNILFYDVGSKKMINCISCSLEPVHVSVLCDKLVVADYENLEYFSIKNYKKITEYVNIFDSDPCDGEDIDSGITSVCLTAENIIVATNDKYKFFFILFFLYI